MPEQLSSRENRPQPWRIEYPPELPVFSRREEIVRAIRENPVLILAGETGSGKTTQLPKLCLEAGRGRAGRIACTQPRRVAALAVSRRVAEELDVSWGREVGCKIRFNDQTSRNTVIKFLTDGMLLSEIQSDRDLRSYDTIIVDEAHERSLNIDFLLGYLNQLRRRRSDLRIVITSATIDTAKFSAAFGGAPIIEVSGRVFPVDVIYAPPETLAVEDALSVVGAAVEACVRVINDSDAGDILVFLPGEREIREALDALEGRKLRRTILLPLFSRLSAGEQQRVFSPTPERKLILATNIAETSLTLPGIRFVIDSGLARLSRYQTRTRTKRLPIEPIAQSNANQRKGRAGRVAEGICIRLYSEEDFSQRPPFATPELQRANLAEVILRLKSARLGAIENFPFIDPPSAVAIRNGYALLEELGAIDPAAPGENGPERPLTQLGWELARLPVDPTVGRMLLQARDERALRETLVIAAALSVQDPRERPEDDASAADAAHKKFANPDSDFLWLLNVWDSFHESAERFSLGRLKKFCRAHFLSFTRMREWLDVHAQLEAAVAELATDEWRVMHDEADSPEDVDDEAAPRGSGGKPMSSGDNDWAFGGERYRAIHRSLLAGLLANVSKRSDGNNFHSTGERRVVLFPGSTLFIRSAKRSAPAETPQPRRQGKDFWIVSAEVVETSRLYARTCARIDVQWALDVGAHVCRISHSEPDWHLEQQRVLSRETTRLHGLEIRSRHIDYGRIDAKRATEIFIDAALVAETLESPHLPFLEYNRRMRAKASTIQIHMRPRQWMSQDDAVRKFYAERLEGISSVHDLQREWRKRAATEPQWLQLTESDLLGEVEELEPEHFPSSVALENSALPIDYAYKPGAPEDGVTLRLPYRQARKITPAMLDWLVPGLLEKKLRELLGALTKADRVRLPPLDALASELSRTLRADGRSLAENLSDVLAQRFQVRVPPDVFSPDRLPPYLRVRIEVVDDAGRAIASGRAVNEIAVALDAHERALSAAPQDALRNAWLQARERFERTGLTDWTFGELPERVVVVESAGVPVYGFPAIVREGAASAALRLLSSAETARAESGEGVCALVEAQLSRELAWLENDLKDLRELGPAAVALMPMERWREDGFFCIRKWACEQTITPLTRDAFVLRVAAAKENLKGIVWKLIDLLKAVLAARHSLLLHATPYATLAGEVEALCGPGFLARTPYEKIPELPRYLRAMQVRCDRWKQDAGRDHRRAQTVAPFFRAFAELQAKPAQIRAARAAIEDLRWLLEEFRVATFAQELGTAQPVSEKRLNEKLAEARRLLATANTLGSSAPTAVFPAKNSGLSASAAQRPMALPSASTEKTKPLKSLGDLGRLLR